MPKTFEHSVGLVTTQVVRVVEAEAPLQLECGKTLAPIDVAYETYGRLNEARDNAVLICHALSGNAHAAGYHSEDDAKPGWWEGMIGPGQGIDTDEYFVICSNVLGGCSGTTGPSSVNPATEKPYGLGFPIITIADMVRVQKLLLENLGIDHLLAVVGGSIGGMQVLQWSIAYPDMMDAALPIATTTHLGAQSIAFDAALSWVMPISATANTTKGRARPGAWGSLA
jgi:homoserine O-acetyltransferase/O-succinyltransferase